MTEKMIKSQSSDDFRSLHVLSDQQVDEINDLIWQLSGRVYEILFNGKID